MTITHMIKNPHRRTSEHILVIYLFSYFIFLTRHFYVQSDFFFNFYLHINKTHARYTLWIKQSENYAEYPREMCKGFSLSVKLTTWTVVEKYGAQISGFLHKKNQKYCLFEWIDFLIATLNWLLVKIDQSQFKIVCNSVYPNIF